MNRVPGSCRSLLDLCLLISFFSGFFGFVVTVPSRRRKTESVCSGNHGRLESLYGVHLLLFDALSTAPGLLLTRIF